MMNDTDEVISKKEEVRSAVEIRFTELQGRTQTGSTFIEDGSDTDKPNSSARAYHKFIKLTNRERPL